MPTESEGKKAAKKSIETGAVGRIKDILVTLQNDVFDRRGITLDQLIFMTRNDGQAKGILNAIKYPVKMARPTIKEPEGGGVRETKFIKECLLSPPSEGGMLTPIQSVISRMALSVRDGYKIFEKVWEYKDGKIRIKKLAYRSTLSTNFTYDKHGEITGARQKVSTPHFIDATWPLDKIAYYVYNAEENPYLGESDFYPVFYHYDKKHKLYAIAHLAYQLNAVPIKIGKHPSNIRPDDLQKFRDTLASLGTMISMTMTDTCEVEAFEGKRSLNEFLPMIQHHDSMMSRAFLVQFMNLGQEGRGGSFALSKDQSNLFLMSLMSLLTEIADVFNRQVIPQLIDWNFGSKKYPRIVFSPFSDTIRSAIMDLYKNLLAARFPQVTPEFALKLEEMVANEVGLELNYKEIEVRQEKERQELLDAEKNATVTPSNQQGDVKPGQSQVSDEQAKAAKNKLNPPQLSEYPGVISLGGKEESDEDLQENLDIVI